MPQFLYCPKKGGEKKTVYPADKRLGWPRSSLDTAENREKLLFLLGI